MKKPSKIHKYTRKAVNVLKNEGVVSLGIKVLTKLQKRRIQTTANVALKRKYTSLVDRENVMKADWSSNPYVAPIVKKDKGPYTVNWVMSPPSGGGGHQNIFRFIEFLDKLGHKNNVYLYSTFDDMTLDEARHNVSSYCNAKNVDFYYFSEDVKPSDILFATGWETAYPVFNTKTNAQKMYFVQDFEPYFYPIGTDYVLAENTYKFGFYGVTAGGFLTKKLSSQYGMRCDYYEFGADTTKYKYLNKGERKEVFFYARPVTERRGFDLGIMALEIFHQKMPDYTINLAGWDVSEWDVPFPYVNHGALAIDDLPELYNKCAAALVISLTNMSLMPLELLGTGTIPIVNKGDNNTQVSDNKYIKYADSSPEALAQAMVDIVTRKDLTKYAEVASKSVKNNSWEESGKKFVQIIEKELNRG